MTKKNVVRCAQCGAEAPNKTYARNEGWLMEWYDESGIAFCCCVCKSAYDRQRKRKSSDKH